MARKLGLVAGVALVATIIGIAASASAEPAPQTLTYACAAKSNGLLKYVAGPSELAATRNPTVGW